MPNHTQPVTILPVTARTDFLESGIKQGTTLYLAWDWSARRFYVVQWDRIRWLCSCGTSACLHRLAVNIYVFELSQKDQPGIPEA
jgi:hypothetical protein